MPVILDNTGSGSSAGDESSASSPVLSGVVQTIPADSFLTARQPVPLMVDMIAGMMGRSDDPDAQSRALMFLDRAADRLNMFGSFLYRLREVNYSTFQAGQTALNLPPDWGWPIRGCMAYDPNDKCVGRIEWQQWDTHRSTLSGDTQNGTPSIISLRSEQDGFASIWPPIDTTEVGRIIVPYMARVSRPSETEELLVSPEIRECLIAGAQGLYLKHRYAKYPNVWTPAMQDFDRMLLGARAAANRWLGAIPLTVKPDFAEDFGSANTLNPSSVLVRFP